MKLISGEKSCRITDPLYETVDMRSILHGKTVKIAGDKIPVGEFLFDHVYKPLLDTFEMKRAKELKQSIFLYNAYPGATHTRQSHAIGCWVVGCYALEDVTVRYNKNGDEERLGDWLWKQGLLSEFMAALLLHDIGHPPFSHALEAEANIEPELDHEKITYSLIAGKPWNENGKWYFDRINWANLLEYLLTHFYISKKKIINQDEFKKNWKRITRSFETNTVYKLLTKKVKSIRGSNENISSSKDFELFSLCSILFYADKKEKDKIVWKNHWAKKYKDRYEENRKIYSALHKLVESDLDIDRIDHFLRDSYYSGKKFGKYNIRDHLQTLVLVIEDKEDYKYIPKPCISIKREGVPHHLYLLFCREMIYDYLFSDLRNYFGWAAFVMGTKTISETDPFFKEIVPFLTDEIILQIFREKTFDFFQLDKYKHLAEDQGIRLDDFEVFSYIVKVKNDDIKKKVNELYRRVIDENREKGKILGLIYSNLPIKKDRNNKKIKKGKIYLDRQIKINKKGKKEGIGIYDLITEQDLEKWMKCHKKFRDKNVILWVHKKASSEVKTNFKDYIKHQMGGEEKYELETNEEACKEFFEDI